MNFNDLAIYKIGLNLTKEVQTLINSKSALSYFSVSKQLVRSSCSVPANIAEGFAKKVYPKEFIRYLNIALGSSDESQSHIAVLFVNNYIAQKEFDYFSAKYKGLSIKILKLIKTIRKDKNIPIK